MPKKQLRILIENRYDTILLEQEGEDMDWVGLPWKDIAAKLTAAGVKSYKPGWWNKFKKSHPVRKKYRKWYAYRGKKGRDYLASKQAAAGEAEQPEAGEDRTPKEIKPEPGQPVNPEWRKDPKTGKMYKTGLTGAAAWKARAEQGAAKAEPAQQQQAGETTTQTAKGTTRGNVKGMRVEGGFVIVTVEDPDGNSVEGRAKLRGNMGAARQAAIADAQTKLVQNKGGGRRAGHAQGGKGGAVDAAALAKQKQKETAMTNVGETPKPDHKTDDTGAMARMRALASRRGKDPDGASNLYNQMLSQGWNPKTGVKGILKLKNGKAFRQEWKKLLGT